MAYHHSSLLWESVRFTATAFLPTWLIGSMTHWEVSANNQWLPIYHINMISSNILSLDSEFSHFIRLMLIILYRNTQEQISEAKLANLGKNFYVADTSLLNMHYYEVPNASTVERFYCSLQSFYATNMLVSFFQFQILNSLKGFQHIFLNIFQHALVKNPEIS